MDNTQLNLATVEKLCKEKFYISYYQRGYRWREDQVCQLLDDLRDFQPTDEVPSYFLQVLIRSPRIVKNNSVIQWNIVDGQQRLTTIDLILKELKTALCINREYDRDNMASLDTHFINVATKAIQAWLKENGSSRDHIIKTLKNAFFLLYDLPFIPNDVEREKAENLSFSEVNDGKLPARDSELVKCVFLTPQKDEPIELTKRRAVEWDEMERALQDDYFFAFLTSRNALDQDDRMTRLFLSAGLVPTEEERKNAVFPFLASFQRECPARASRRDIWERIANSFIHFRGWYRDNTAFHAIGWYLHQNDDGINNFNLGKVKERIAAIAAKLKTARGNEDLYNSNRSDANQLLFLFNCAFAWRTTHMRYDFYEHNHVDVWSLEHMRATNIKPQDSETFATYISACPEDKRVDFTFENYERANAEGKGEAFLSEHLGEDEYPKDADNSLGNLASLPRNPNSSLNNKLFRDKREEILKWFLGPAPDYFVPPATAAVFAKAIPGMEKEKLHLSLHDKECYLDFMDKTITLFQEAINNVF
jgi:hypothetical protein